MGVQKEKATELLDSQLGRRRGDVVVLVNGQPLKLLSKHEAQVNG